jgi:hypothetical protein
MIYQSAPAGGTRTVSRTPSTVAHLSCGAWEALIETMCDLKVLDLGQQLKGRPKMKVFCRRRRWQIPFSMKRRKKAGAAPWRNSAKSAQDIALYGDSATTRKLSRFTLPLRGPASRRNICFS